MNPDPTTGRAGAVSDPWDNDEGWQCDPATDQAVSEAVGMWPPIEGAEDEDLSSFYPAFAPEDALTALRWHVESFRGSFSIEFEQPSGPGSDQWRVFINDPDRSKGRAMSMGSTICEAACCAILLDKQLHG